MSLPKHYQRWGNHYTVLVQVEYDLVGVHALIGAARDTPDKALAASNFFKAVKELKKQFTTEEVSTLMASELPHEF